MKVALITSCTNRKRVVPLRQLRGQSLPSASLTKLAGEWASRLQNARTQVAARDFYAGRSFTEALAAAEGCEGALHIVSAGVGLIHVDDPVPPYSLTVTGRVSDNILTRVKDEEALPAHWWAALNGRRRQGKPLSRLLASKAADLYVLALPSTYIDLVVEDLGSLTARAAAKVRVIGLPSLSDRLPPLLVSSLVSYDERLENTRTGYAGTRADFVQRAARHFTTRVLSLHASGSADVHAAEVQRFLSGFTRRRVQQRERIPDDRVKQAIRDLWKASGGRAAHSLRMLRRERRLSCEQSRFKRLFWEVAAEKGVEA
jgi:hypothetical protein